MIIVVRHGESEGNVANAVDASRVPDAFWPRPAATWRLTDRGIEQARALGVSLGATGLFPVDTYRVSPMARALETAAHLDVPDARWQIEPALAERAWGGEMRALDHDGRARFTRRAGEELRADRWGWAPPGGESLAAVQSRLRTLLHCIGDEHPGGSALLVTHGEVIMALRAHVEGVAAAEGTRAPGTGLAYRFSEGVWWTADLGGHPPRWTVPKPTESGAELLGRVQGLPRHVR
ncbi:histidine phosphatase family protein [Lentzea sp. HUAS TT2]|uniref:histidine phosphatase family protein n=1 Tax=Lentzea sp. HUAS TT2 TaxID=3447454 RepID=UPI003F72D6AE